MVGKKELTEKELEYLTMAAAGLNQGQIAIINNVTKQAVTAAFMRIKKYAIKNMLMQNVKGRSVMNYLPLLEKYNLLSKANELKDGFYAELEHELSKLKRKKRVA